VRGEYKRTQPHYRIAWSLVLEVGIFEQGNVINAAQQNCFKPLTGPIGFNGNESLDG